MKSSQTLEKYRKMESQELIKEQNTLRHEVLQKIAKVSEEGLKSSNEIRKDKKNIARIETILSERIDEMIKEKEKNG